MGMKARGYLVNQVSQLKMTDFQNNMFYLKHQIKNSRTNKAV